MRLEAVSSGAVTPAQFAAAMAQFRLPLGACIAVAVSGGADSLALIRLLSPWARQRQIGVFGLTVDHQLRDAAAIEAAQVAAWLAPHHIPHVTLRWNDGPHARTLTRSAQSAAREARYRLMTDWCLANDCTHLFVAHHADDQVETFLLRLARGSGVDGLAAMAPASSRDGIVIARPLLGFTKAQLTAVCRELDQPWIEDPSNLSSASARVRFRQAREVLEREGLTRERLLATVGHLQRARAALDHAVAALLARGWWDKFGVARLPVADLLSAPEEIALRALARLLAAAGGQAFGPRFESLARLYGRLTAGPWSDATLHGCLITRDGADVVVAREPAQITDDKTLAGNTSVIWDGRYRLTLAVEGAAPVFTVSRFKDSKSEQPLLADLPARVRGTLPALYDSAGLVAVPHAGYLRADIARLPGFSLGVASISAPQADSSGGDAKL